MSRTRLEICEKSLVISSKLTGEGVQFENADKADETLHNRFRITITRLTESGIIRRSFNYYGSMIDYEGAKVVMDEKDMLFAFRCFVEDGISGNNTFEDFCSEFGYDTDSRRAEKVFKACQESHDKFLSLGFYDSELNDILDELSKKGIE